MGSVEKSGIIQQWWRMNHDCGSCQLDNECFVAWVSEEFLLIALSSFGDIRYNTVEDTVIKCPFPIYTPESTSYGSQQPSVTNVHLYPWYY